MKKHSIDDWLRTLDPVELENLANLEATTPKDRQSLLFASRRLRDKLPFLKWQKDSLVQVYERLTTNTDSSSDINFHVDQSNSEARHVTIRMAWHDSAWNGHVCKNPERNSYCVGSNSLLSSRIQTRRQLNIESKADVAGKPAKFDKTENYQPPCFWSINAFGNETLEFEHDNPVAPDFKKIPTKLEPYSVITWPFGLSFVRESHEREKFGSYFPKDQFEGRIKRFQNLVRENESIAFLYCKYSNPLTEEDGTYLITGFSLIKKKEPLKWFDVSENQLEETRSRLKQKNFPTLNWALQYQLDFESTGVRLPYHECFNQLKDQEELRDNHLDEIKVSVDESELTDSFMYVARHADDDQAIYLLMKIRKSLLLGKEARIVKNYNFEEALAKVDFLLKHCWDKRGYFPGFQTLLNCLLGIQHADDVEKLSNFIKSRDQEYIEDLPSKLEQCKITGFENICAEIVDACENRGIEITDLLRLSSLNLTVLQFQSILDNEIDDLSVASVGSNPYSIFESYIPSEDREDPRWGYKVDGDVDLFKIDLAMFPMREYVRRISWLHFLKQTGKERIRALITDTLWSLESKGHCFEFLQNIENSIKQYPLFYKYNEEFSTNLKLSDLPPVLSEHPPHRVGRSLSQHRV